MDVSINKNCKSNTKNIVKTNNNNNINCNNFVSI